MAEYIPPHVRGDATPDKSKFPPLNNIFEPRELVDSQNITIRRFSSVNNVASEAIGDKGIDTVKNDAAEIDPDNDPTPIHPQLFTMLQSIDTKLENQGATLDKMTVSQNMMQKSIDFGHANSSDLKDRIVMLEKENQKLISQNKELKSQGRDVTRRLDSIDQQLAQMDHNNRRRNILIDGVRDTTGENTMDITIDILTVVDQSISRGDIDFTQRVYRPGNKVKPILVVLKSVAQRDSIMGKKKLLKGRPNLSNVWLNEDSNPMIRKQKLESRTVVKHAVAKGYDAKQRGLGVVVNGRYYTRNNMGQLPDDIKLSTTKTRMDNNTVGFQGKLAPLSNMYMCPIVVDGRDHKSAEHYIQYTKVMLVNLTELAQAIQDTNCPYAAKSIGGSVHIPIWDDVGEDVVKQAIRYKYDQNPQLKKILLETGTRTILECTPDMKWGAAISLDSKLFGTGRYPGQNVTGHSLQELRVEYRDMEQPTEVTPPPQQIPPPTGNQTQSTETRVQPAAERVEPVRPQVPNQPDITPGKENKTEGNVEPGT